MPFFSVIVPAYNSAEYIRKGLDSIKEQAFTDYELIIVCDSCTDNTEEIRLCSSIEGQIISNDEKLLLFIIGTAVEVLL